MSSKKVFFEIILKGAAAKQMENVSKSFSKTKQSAKILDTQLGKLDKEYKKVESSSRKAGNAGRRAADDSTKSTDKAKISLKGLTPVIVKNYLAYLALQKAINGIANEFIAGFKAVEDFKVSVASTAGFITTFSQKTAEGDLAGGFRDAYAYAERLIPALEQMDALTIANGEDLNLISQAFIKNGILLDIDNKKQKQGFLAIATALKALFANTQNGQLQMNQEINALLAGQVRAGDKLAQILTKQDPLLHQHLKTWREEGTVIEHIGKMLGGFGMVAKKLDGSWAEVGSTLETINKVILREGFKPVVEDILAIANNIKNTLLDSEGKLTQRAKDLQQSIKDVYKLTKDTVEVAGGMAGGWLAATVALGVYKSLIVDATALQTTLNIVTEVNPWVILGTAAAGAFVLMKKHLDSLTDDLIKGKDASIEFFEAPKDFDRDAFLKYLKIKDIVEQINDLKTNGIRGEWFESQSEIDGQIDKLEARLNGILGGASGAVGRALKASGEPLPSPVIDAKAPELSVDVTTYQKSLEEREKLTAKYAAKREAINRKLYEAINAQTSRLMKSGEAKDLLREKEYWGKLKAELLRNVDEAAKIRAKTVRPDIEKTSGYKSYNDKIIADQVKAASEFKKLIQMQVDDEVITKREGLIAIKKYEKEQLQEAKRMLDSYVLDRVKTDEQYLTERKRIITEITASEKRGIEAITSKYDLEQKRRDKIKEDAAKKKSDKKTADALKKQLDDVSNYYDKVKFFDSKYRQYAIDNIATVIDNMSISEQQKAVLKEKSLEELRKMEKKYTFDNIEDTHSYIAAMKAGTQSYIDGSKGMLTSLRDWTTDTFKTMGDSLAEFVRTGKFNFGDFTKSILNDMAKIASQQAASALLGLLVQAGTAYFTPSAGDGGYVGNSTGGGTSSLPAGQVYSAQGNVFSGAGISAYSNSIVSKPTIFPFAHGVGLMGEAGSEAIMPLTRTANGDLGVKAQGGGNNITINNEIVVQGGSGDEADNKKVGKQIALAIKASLRGLLKDELRNGNILNPQGQGAF